MASVYEQQPMEERHLERKPLSELVSSGLSQLSGLMRSEMALARAEMADNAKQAMRGGMMLGGAAFLALPSLAILMLALVAFLVEMGLAASVSSLITAVIGFAIAGMLAKIGMQRLKADLLVPNRTLNQLQRDAATMKEHI